MFVTSDTQLETFKKQQWLADDEGCVLFRLFTSANDNNSWKTRHCFNSRASLLFHFKRKWRVHDRSYEATSQQFESRQSQTRSLHQNRSTRSHIVNEYCMCAWVLVHSDVIVETRRALSTIDSRAGWCEVKFQCMYHVVICLEVCNQTFAVPLLYSLFLLSFRFILEPKRMLRVKEKTQVHDVLEWVGNEGCIDYWSTTHCTHQ